MIIVTIGLGYAACKVDHGLWWFFVVAVLAQAVYCIIKSFYKENQALNSMNIFFAELKHSPDSENFDNEEVRENLQRINAYMAKEIFLGIQNELTYQDDQIYIKNLLMVLNEIRQRVSDCRIEAFRYSKRKNSGNYACMYANSLNFPLSDQHLTDEKILKVAGQFSDAELVFIILDTSNEILNTTADYTTGRTEEMMEIYYHNNLRRIESVLRKELSERFLYAKN
jgi:hypothetical protein